MSIVYHGNTALTNNIGDEKRAAMAYNVFRSMTNHGVKLGDSGEALDADKLCLIDENGVSTVPELDKEWFGTEEDNDKAREAVLDSIIDEMKQEGCEPDRDFERDLMDEYTVTYRSRDVTTTYFVDSSWDLDKARDVYSIVTKDIAPGVSLAVHNDFEEMDVDLTGGLQNLNVVNMDGDVYNPEKPVSFGDAVADLSGPEPGMER